MRLRLSLLWLLLLTSTAMSADPAWWAGRGVKTTAPAANLSPATIGQAKHMAAMALAELQGHLPAPAFQALQTDLAAVVNLSLPNPLPPGYHETQRAVLLNGQLKAIAKPFYDHLRTHTTTWLDNSMAASNLVVMEPGSNPPMPSPYPWSVAATDDANRAPATLGQLKAVFSLPLETLPDQDTDGDGMPDEWETIHGINPADPLDAALDSDNDGLTNREEYEHDTNLTNSDSDGDGMLDGWEVSHALNPLDTTDANNDADGDGMTNFQEYQAGTNPNQTDSDGDGMPDPWEVLYEFNPADPSDASLDFDNDGLINQVEHYYGTDPKNSDSDGDGMPDKWEIDYYLNPMDSSDAVYDGDGDGLTNLQEYQAGTNPTNSDTDGDGALDGDESSGNTNPTDPGSAPQEGWIVLTGDQAQGERKVINRTITIPKGQTRVAIVALHSEEYPVYTEDHSEFNDLLEWEITPTGGTEIAGQTNVNDKHADWQVAAMEGTEIKNFTPVHIEKVSSLTAPAETDLTVTLVLAATNTSDGALPSTVMVGLLPCDLSSPKAFNSPWWIQAEFGSTDIFDPRNPEPTNEQKAIDSSLIIYFNDVRKADNTVEDFDIKLKFGPISGATWSKFDGPESGILQNANQAEATYSNPKKGGLYRYDVHFAGKATRTQVWLPKAGPDISSFWEEEIDYFRITWGPAYRSKLNDRTWFLAGRPIMRAAVKHAKALVDMNDIGDELDWMNPGTGEGEMIRTETSPEGGPFDATGGEWRYTIKGYVIDWRKRNNMMYALIGKEMALLEEELINGPKMSETNTPDGPAALQAYEAGFDLHDGKSLEQTMKDYGYKMQEPGSWAQREWPSDEATSKRLRRKAPEQLDQLIK